MTRWAILICMGLGATLASAATATPIAPEMVSAFARPVLQATVSEAEARPAAPVREAAPLDRAAAPVLAWSAPFGMVDPRLSIGVHHRETTLAGHTLTLDTVKLRSAKAFPTALAPVARSALMIADVGYTLIADAQDHLSLGAMMRWEKRRTAIDLTGGRAVHSLGQSIALRWRHGALSADLGWFADRVNGASHGLARTVALASGAPLAGSGMRIAASYLVAAIGTRERLSFGLNLATMALARSDIAALGARSGTDRRATAGLRLTF